MKKKRFEAKRAKNWRAFFVARLKTWSALFLIFIQFLAPFSSLLDVIIRFEWRIVLVRVGLTVEHCFLDGFRNNAFDLRA
jgi:hypothetical protein